MGWRGTLRSVNAAMRAAERESQRRHKQHAKELEFAEAAEAVGAWKAYVHDLVSIHANPADGMNWHEIAGSAKPSIPVSSSRRTELAQADLDAFEPSIWDFFSGGSEKKREVLASKLIAAAESDEEGNRKAIANYEHDLADWKSDVALAERLLSGDIVAKKDVIEEFQSLSSENLVGSEVVFRINPDWLHAIATIHSDEVVPSYRRKLLASGRLSETKMPIGQFNELYQDYACSVALKVAGDLFGLLPDDEIFVTCRALMLNTKTGHQELTPVLSVHFVRATYERLNLAGVDPSDCLSNFNHNMVFKRTKGFAATEPLKPIEEQVSGYEV